MMHTGFLGIDVSKGYSDFVLLNEQFKPLAKPLQLDDTPRGHRLLANWLDNQIKTHGLNHVYAAAESTGGFENNWHALFIDLGKTRPVQVARLNPLVVKNAAKATLSDQVSDGLSAAHIAEYLIRYGDKVRWQSPETKYRRLRSFDNHIRLLVRQRMQLVAQFKQLLYYCFPTLQRFCRDNIPNWIFELLKKYPTPGKLGRARATTVAKINYITESKAKALIKAARQSVAARGRSEDGFLMTSMGVEIQAKSRRISELKALLTQQCEGPETALLETIPGIAAYSAAAVMIQIEDIRRFATPARLAGYFGVYPALKESGDKKPKVRMSKKGRAAMRAILFTCAGNVVLHDEHMKKIYDRHRAKGKSHKQALGVIMHKLLRVIWGMLTHGAAYNADTDRKHQQKNPRQPAESQRNEVHSKRRIQPFDELAPISRIAAQKRKAYRKSQASISGQERDQPIRLE